SRFLRSRLLGRLAGGLSGRGLGGHPARRCRRPPRRRGAVAGTVGIRFSAIPDALGTLGRPDLAVVELEADLAVGLLDQEGLELAAGARRDETGQQVGASFGQKLAHL